MINTIRKGMWVKELSKIQKRKEVIIEEKNELSMFPICPCEAGRYTYSLTDNIYSLAEIISDLWLKRISEDDFNEGIKRIYKIENATTYFETLGNYFIVLSGNTERLNKLDTELEGLKK